MEWVCILYYYIVIFPLLWDWAYTDSAIPPHVPRPPLLAVAQCGGEPASVCDRNAGAMRECYAGGVFYLYSKKINEFKDIRSYEY